MAEGPTVAYSTRAMRGGAGQLTQVSDHTLAATVALQNAPLQSVMFGLTPGAEVFTTALQAARAAQARGFTQEADRSSELAAGTDGAADLGDQLHDDLLGTARRATPGGG